MDLGAPRELVELRLYPDSATHRVAASNLEVWVEEGGEFLKVVGVTTSVEAGSGTVVMRLNEPVISSQVKVHCLYDQRDGQDQAKEYVEFKNQASKLLEVRYRVQRTRESYSYDAKGNRTQVQTTTVEAPGAHTSTLTASYWAQTDRVKRYGEWTYVYDGNGNLVEKGTGYTEGEGFAADSGWYVRYDWDLFGRLEKVSRGEAGTGSAVEVARYGYDADGLRVEKTVPGSSGSEVTRWVYGPDGNVVLEQGGSCRREYVYAEGKLLGYWELRGTEEQKYYTLTDQVGSVVSTTDESGVEVSKRDYLAFGTEAGTEGTAETVALYTGKEWDEEAGLYYYNARWYDPELGRFISEDPVKDQANWYAYCGNCPLVYVDPTGQLFILDDLLFATVGAIAGAISGGISSGAAAAGNGGNFWDVTGAALGGAAAGAATGAFQGFIGSLIGGPVGGTIGAITGTLSGVSIGAGIGAGAYNNAFTLLSDITWNSIGSAIGGIEVILNTIQNIIDPGTAILNYELTQRYGSLCYDTNERSWSTRITGGRPGFGLGNVSQGWSEDTYYNWYRRYGYSDDEARGIAQKRHQEILLHESIHSGQQRVWGPISIFDLAVEQISSVFLGADYPYMNSVLLGFERHAYEHERDGTSFYADINQGRW